MRQTPSSRVDETVYFRKWEALNLEELMTEETRIQGILSGGVRSEGVIKQMNQVLSLLQKYIANRVETEFAKEQMKTERSQT